MQRIKDQERVQLSKLSPEAQVMMEIWLAYKEKVEELTFSEYGRLIKLMKRSHIEYCGYTDAAYYTMLGKFKYRDIMMDIFFKKAKITPLEKKTRESINNKTLLC